MDKFYDFILCVGGIISVALSWVFKGVSKDLLTVLLVVMIIDMILGLVKGIQIKSLSSRVFSAGITKKLLKWFLLGGVSICEYTVCDFVGVEGNTHVCTTFFIGTYILSEMISIVENANDLGLGIPSWVKPLLTIVRKEKIEKMPSFVGAAMAQYLKLDIDNEDLDNASGVNNVVSDEDALDVEDNKDEDESDNNSQSA